MQTVTQPACGTPAQAQALLAWLEENWDMPGVSLDATGCVGICQFKPVVEDIRAGKRQYDFIEIMACPGGCVNGGGQPFLFSPNSLLSP